MAISGVGQSYYQNNVATTKSTKSVNSTGETGNTKWKIWIVTKGTVSTSTETIKVYYTY